MAKVSRRQYVDEFRAEADHLAQALGRSIACVVRDIWILDNVPCRSVCEEREAQAP